MMKPTPMMPTVYLETSDSQLKPETIVNITWEDSRVERKSFATLAEALEFAHRLCETDEDDAIVVV
jgi:hypothetical protein